MNAINRTFIVPGLFLLCGCFMAAALATDKAGASVNDSPPSGALTLAGAGGTATPTSAPTIDLLPWWDPYYYACDNLGFFLTVYTQPQNASVPVTTTLTMNGWEFVVPPF